MAYIIDLQQLWEGNAAETASSALAGTSLESRKNVVSVVVVAQPNVSMLTQTLQSILAQQFVREVIIVNCEESAALEKALTKFASACSKCYIVRGHKKAGLAASYNLGAQHASGQFLLFMKSDCLLAKNAIAKLLATGVRKPAPWVIGAADKNAINAFKPLGRFNKLFTNAFESLKYETKQQQSLPEVSLAGGGFHVSNIGPECLFLSTQCFLELKGLDKKCFHSTFHVDLCLRIHFAGGGVYRAREFDMVANTSVKQTLREALRQEWHAFCGRYHLYQKYVSKYTNKMLMAFFNSTLFVGFIGRVVFRLFATLLPRPTKKPVLIKQNSFN